MGKIINAPSIHNLGEPRRSLAMAGKSKRVDSRNAMRARSDFFLRFDALRHVRGA
jgi:hypothetical protein